MVFGIMPNDRRFVDKYTIIPAKKAIPTILTRLMSKSQNFKWCFR